MRSRTEGSCTGSDIRFSGNISLSRYSDNVGIFYYYQPSQDGCQTDYRGVFSTNGGSNWSAETVIAGPFPAINMSMTGGLGHYTTSMPEGFTGNYLFTTWAQPVISDPVACYSCSNHQWSETVNGARILP